MLEIRAVEVESWLKSLNRAPGTRCKIRNVMSLLFNHGRRHDLCDRNPIEWVRQSGKRRTAPDILTTRFDASSICRCRAEDHARAAAPFDNSRDSRHIHAGSHNGKAKCAGGSCRALVPRKNAGDVSSAWKNSISCTYFVPTRKWGTFGKFFMKEWRGRRDSNSRPLP